MISSRTSASTATLAAAGALVATLAVAGCSSSGGARTADGAASSAAPSATASSTTPSATAATTTPAPAPSTAGSTPAASSPSSPSAPTSQQAPAGPAPGTPAGSGDDDPGRCATGDLTVAVGGGSGGAAGSVLTAVVLTNTGPTACTLRGYPSVSYVAGSDGHQVGAAAARDGGGGAAALVALGPGDVAHATLRIVDHQAYPDEKCRPRPVDGYRIYPPGSRDAAFVRRSGTACSAQDARVLSVQPVEPGPPPSP